LKPQCLPAKTRIKNKRVLRILGVARFIEMVLALEISDIDHSNVNLQQSFILKEIFFCYFVK